MDKEFLEIVDDGNPTGSVQKGDKRAKSTQPNPSPRSSTRQNERNASRTRSPKRKKVPVEECFDGPARITSKELAPIHSVKNGILQVACSTSPRMDADWGKVLFCASPG